MKRLLGVTCLMIFFLVAQGDLFAAILDCEFKGQLSTEVRKVQFIDETLVINETIEIPLEKSKVRCGNFRRQVRWDGSAKGHRVVLKSCTTEADLEGYLIDSNQSKALDLLCHSL